MLGALASPALLSQQLGGLPQAVMAAQAPGVITGTNMCSPAHTYIPTPHSHLRDIQSSESDQIYRISLWFLL